MSELTESQLKEKIEIVKKDIASLDGGGRKVEALTQYLEYLNDELANLKLIDKP